MSRSDRDAQPVSILYVSPEPATKNSVFQTLQTRDEFSFSTATTTSEALQQFHSRQSYDCIVSDHSLPDVDGLSLLETVRVQDPNLPFIIFTDTGDESVASQAISANVTEYLIETAVNDQADELAALILDAIDFQCTRSQLTDQRLALDSIFEATPHGMVVFQDDSFLKINQAGLDLLGVESRDEVTDIDLVSILDRESGAFTAETIDGLQQRDEFIDRERHTITATDRTVTPIELTAAPINWNDRTAILLIARDISDERQRKTTLERFKQAIEHSGHAIYITDADATIEYVNPAFEDITGYSASEAVGQDPRFLESGETTQAEYDRLWHDPTRGRTWEGEVINRRKSGETYVAYQTIAPVTDPDGSISAYVGIQIDITDQKEERTQLELYRQTVHNASDLLAAVDEDSRILFANRRYRAFHGISDDVEVTDTPLQQLLDAERYAEIADHIDAALGGRRVSFEITRENGAGEDRTLNVQYFPLRDVDGAIIGAAASMRDVTDKHELLEEIRNLAEHRRVLSAVKDVLMRAESSQTALPEVAEIIASSELFSCTYAATVDDDEPQWVCASDSELADTRVTSFHEQQFLDTVFDERVHVMDDVTTSPFDQHSSAVASHAGVALALTHNDKKLGVLTVHLPPSASIEEAEIRLLSQLADDLGLFLYNQSLEHEYQTFQEIAERIDDPIMLENLDGEFEVVNDAVSEYAGLPKSELYDADEFAFMDEPAATEIADRKAQVLRTESPIEYEITPEFPTKGERSFATTRYPHYDDSDELDGTVAICRDVSGLKDREKQMRVMDRVLRHNVNNDMNIVQGYAELIAEECSDPTVLEYATPIIEHSERLLDLVEKERQITSTLSETLELEEFDLVSTLRTVCNSISDAYPSATLQTDLPTACAIQSTKHIAEAVEELLRNAIEHAEIQEPTVTLTVRCSSSGATIEISDSNPPIPEMERDVLRGTQNIEPLLHGSGLGLWLVNHIVRSADGRLTFTERSPTGNRVTIELPTSNGTDSGSE